MKSALRNLLFISTALTLSAAPVNASDNFTDEQKAEIGSMIADYISSNPGLIKESLQAHQVAEEEQRKVSEAEMLKKNMGKMTSGNSPVAGNPEGEIVVVEFFDYNCGYCKKALPDIQKVIDDEKDVRVIFKEMPILGPSSLTAAQWALAAHKQGKYFEYHAELMNQRGQKDAAALGKIAKKLGLDVEQMKKDAASPEINKHIQDDIAMAREVGIRGTPGFIVGDKLYPGYLGDGGLKREIATFRKNSNK